MGLPLNVLIVEDSEDDTQLIMREIRHGGYDVEWERVQTRIDMSSALKRKDWHLIICDHSLPQFNSLDALEVLHESGKDLPFIIASGSIGEEAAVEVLKAGAHDFVSKDKMVRLIPAIRRELREAETRRERRRAEQELLASEERYRTLAEAAHDAIFVINIEGVLEYINESGAGLLGYQPKEIIGRKLESLFPPALGRGWQMSIETIIQMHQPNYDESKVDFPQGTLWLGTRLTPLYNEDGQVRAALGISRDITERKRAEEKIHQQLERLTALNSIDQAINSNFDIKTSLSILLLHTTKQLSVDAADILLFDPKRNILQYLIGHGFRTTAIEKTELRIDECFAGRAVLQRQMIATLNSLKTNPAFTREELLEEEDFSAQLVMPLIAKGVVKGVMEVFQRTPLEPNQEWTGFLNTLAGQAAIAIDNFQLFEGLQISNNELKSAYDTTIEGWSHALDLRDKETEGHTQRVTEMTLRLARATNMTGDQLANVRRGALLHDIGKMGVPDSILLKPETLTDEEWVVMRKHPTFAYELLWPIKYLRPALDIPYCHHEKWNGNGYPRGLKGDQIPLIARLFAVVDVWDALRSNRPYRKAWPEVRTRDYIRSQSGTDFDPYAVKLFFEVFG